MPAVEKMQAARGRPGRCPSRGSGGGLAVAPAARYWRVRTWLLSQQLRRAIAIRFARGLLSVELVEHLVRYVGEVDIALGVGGEQMGDEAPPAGVGDCGYGFLAGSEAKLFRLMAPPFGNFSVS